jgi:hypothetical protein
LFEIQTLTIAIHTRLHPFSFCLQLLVSFPSNCRPSSGASFCFYPFPHPHRAALYRGFQPVCTPTIHTKLQETTINTQRPYLAHSNPNHIPQPVSIAPAPVFEPLIDAEHAAKLLGNIHPKTLMRKARTGEIPGYQFARAWFFRASELDLWLRTRVRSNTANTFAA